jgi:flagellum-specific ATP synthase
MRWNHPQIEPFLAEGYLKRLEEQEVLSWTGKVTRMTGLRVESKGPAAAVGDFCEIRTASGRSLISQVIGFQDGYVLSMPLEEPTGLQPGDLIIARSSQSKLRVGPELLGRVLDGLGRPLDDGLPIEAEDLYDLYAPPPNPLHREHILKPLCTGVRAIDGLLPVGEGQRMGIFGGSGVGKSTLLGVMSRQNSADVTVIALIGERNREVKAFLDSELDDEARRRSVVVAATSDRPAPVRIRAAYVALTVAEYFRDQGANVLLIMDSATRLAMAQREVGLAAGEPPSQKGYTPSVFALLPKILERVGRFRTGSITGFFTVLVEGDDFNEPICDAVRGILDGHIILSRELAASGHYPAIDVLSSISRLAPQISAPEHLEAAAKLKESMALYRRSEDMILLGAHVAGVNPKLDTAIARQDQINNYLRQPPQIRSSNEETLDRLQSLARLLQ